MAGSPQRRVHLAGASKAWPDCSTCGRPGPFPRCLRRRLLPHFGDPVIPELVRDQPGRDAELRSPVRPTSSSSTTDPCTLVLRAASGARNSAAKARLRCWRSDRARVSSAGVPGDVSTSARASAEVESPAAVTSSPARRRTEGRPYPPPPTTLHPSDQRRRGRGGRVAASSEAGASPRASPSASVVGNGWPPRPRCCRSSRASA